MRAEPCCLLLLLHRPEGAAEEHRDEIHGSGEAGEDSAVIRVHARLRRDRRAGRMSTSEDPRDPWCITTAATSVTHGAHDV